MAVHLIPSRLYSFYKSPKFVAPWINNVLFYLLSFVSINSLSDSRLTFPLLSYISRNVREEC
jgi:hypothetical protein